MFKIVKTEKHGNYVLEDEETKKQHSLVIQFFEVQPKVGDKLFLHEKLFDKTFVGFSQPFSFEPAVKNSELMLQLGKNPDLAVVVCGGKKLMLKRIYG